MRKVTKVRIFDIRLSTNHILFPEAIAEPDYSHSGSQPIRYEQFAISANHIFSALCFSQLGVLHTGLSMNHIISTKAIDQSDYSQ